MSPFVLLGHGIVRRNADFCSSETHFLWGGGGGGGGELSMGKGIGGTEKEASVLVLH